MRELDDSNWFSKWEDELPRPDELMPLSQSLITPHLALAFNIPNNPHTHPPHPQQPHPHPPPAPHHPLSSSQANSSAEFDSPEGGGGSDEPARTLKRPRLVWTPQLHKRFVDAVAHLGIKNAVPKTIMQLMSVDGLTRENVASHLQKYRLYLKRMQAGNSSSTGMDAATDRLFASSPVPAHFLHPGRANSEHFMPFVPVAAAMQHHHQMGVGVGVGQGGIHHQHHQQMIRHFGNSPPTNNGHLEVHHPFVRQATQVVGRMGNGGPGVGVGGPPVYVEDLESASGRRVLTLFPTGDD